MYYFLDASNANDFRGSGGNWGDDNYSQDFGVRKGLGFGGGPMRGGGGGPRSAPYSGQKNELIVLKISVRTL